jgi:hypothetical protein
METSESSRGNANAPATMTTMMSNTPQAMAIHCQDKPTIVG